MNWKIGRFLVIPVAMAFSLLATGCNSGAAAGAEEPELHLDRTRLSKVLSSSQVDGFTVELQHESLLSASDIVTADKNQCQPILDFMSSRPRYPRHAEAWAILHDSRDRTGAGSGLVFFSAHSDSDATAWMRGLRKAVDECGKFNGSSTAGWAHSYILSPLPPCEVGDESVCYQLGTSPGSEGRKSATIIMRTGGILAMYESSDIDISGRDSLISLARDHARSLKEEAR